MVKLNDLICLLMVKSELDALCGYRDYAGYLINRHFLNPCR